MCEALHELIGQPRRIWGGGVEALLECKFQGSDDCSCLLSVLLCRLRKTTHHNSFYLNSDLVLDKFY